MPRNMSFAITTQQFRDRTKTVTRRWGWDSARPGDIVMGVEKAMGLKAGEKMVKLGLIRIVSIIREPLNQITKEDCVLEGFPDFSPDDFIRMILKGDKKHKPNSPINRIEYEYLDSRGILDGDEIKKKQDALNKSSSEAATRLLKSTLKT